MGRHATQEVIDRYFQLMGRGEDFTDCYVSDVTWTTFDDGTQIHGPRPIRDNLGALHQNMVDAHTRRLICAASAAYLEGDCADPLSADTNRIAYCVAHVADGRISAMRCYGTIPRLAI